MQLLWPSAHFCPLHHRARNRGHRPRSRIPRLPRQCDGWAQSHGYSTNCTRSSGAAHPKIWNRDYHLASPNKMFTLLAVILSAQTALAATTPFMNLAMRQSVTPTAACVDACTPLSDAITAAGPTVGDLCTSTIVNAFAECYDCLVAGGTVIQDIAQETVNDYVEGCTAEGFPVSGATVSGSSSEGDSGTSGTTTAGESTSTTTASGGSSEGDSETSGITTAGESTSTTASGGSTGSSNGSSSSSSNSGSSSGGKSSSSSGGGLGGGFKSSHAVHTSVGYLTAVLMFGLSVVLLQNS
ncbi:hypothetical protein C8R45DRAFT_542403 [Mycena sanguinolenta]|nr:hypothetical protein C8R45DRAFT_542403 [Mycena sanguinolenta]